MEVRFKLKCAGSSEPPARSKSRTIWSGNAANDTVNFVIDVVENDHSGLVLWLEALPSIAHEPITRLLGGKSAHIGSMVWRA
jgi:hypothetical protein